MILEEVDQHLFVSDKKRGRVMAQAFGDLGKSVCDLSESVERRQALF
jgi:hypothetical protein